MMSFLALHELAAGRGDGLHPQLRTVFERLTAGHPCENERRSDGMLQAGPDPIGTTVNPDKTQRSIANVSNIPRPDGAY